MNNVEKNTEASVSSTSHEMDTGYPIKSAIATLAISFAYLVFIHYSIGLRVDHVAIIGLYNIGFLAHRKTRTLISALAIFLVFGVLYDIMKIYPNHLVNTVDIENIYDLEKHIFGIASNGNVLTPNEYFSSNHNVFMDIATGLFYLNWMSVPILFGLYLLKKNKRRYLHYAFAFLLVNILGFCIYYLYPAAPPWYIDQYGFVFHQTATGSAAELVRFDEYLSCNIFQSIYTRNSNVFAAVPSLHSAYPVVVLFYAMKTSGRAMLTFSAVFMLGIWFSAVYSGHHYVLDVVLGVLCALVGIAIFHYGILKLDIVRRALLKYERFISNT